jgi:glycine/D-amino acid oxidase-like deaminating enzyme
MGKPSLTADVVILGGGPAGTAAAWALRRNDPNLKLALLEKTERLAAGSSTASLECFRTAWPCTPIAAQMRHSIKMLESPGDFFEGVTQSDLGIKQQGYLWLAFTETQVEALQSDVSHLHRLGFSHIQLMRKAVLEKHFPWLTGKALAAKLDDRAGWLDSNALVHVFARHTAGLVVHYNVQEVQIETLQDRVVGVRWSGGAISTDRVILAAGAEVFEIGRRSGFIVPVVLRPRQSVTISYRHADFPGDSPMLITPGGAHVRPEAGEGVILGWEYAWNNKHIKPGLEPLRDHLIEPVSDKERLKDPRFPSLALKMLARQFNDAPETGFNSPRYLKGLRHNVGYYVTRDHTTAYRTDDKGTMIPYESERAIIDFHPNIKGIVLSVAHVGHGIMTAPAAGEIAACLTLDKPLPDPAYHDLGVNVSWVPHDDNAL